MKRYLSLLLCLFPLLCGGFQATTLHPQERVIVAEKDLVAAKTKEDRFYLLGVAAMANYEAEHFKQAEKYAKELITLATNDPKHGNYHNAIHKGNLVLGRLALKDGNTEKAKSYLLASVEFSGSPRMTILGPNMTLAKELLEKKEREIVLKFITQCESVSEFWALGKMNLTEWQTQIKEGKTPDFGSYLYY